MPNYLDPLIDKSYYDIAGMQPDISVPEAVPTPLVELNRYPVALETPAAVDPRNPFARGTILGEEPWYVKLPAILNELTRGTDWNRGIGFWARQAKKGHERELSNVLRAAYATGEVPAQLKEGRTAFGRFLQDVGLLDETTPRNLEPWEVAAAELGASMRGTEEEKIRAARLKAAGKEQRNPITGLTTNQAITRYTAFVNAGLNRQAEELRVVHPELEEIFSPYTAPGMTAAEARLRGINLGEEEFGYRRSRDVLENYRQDIIDRRKANAQRVKELRRDLNNFDIEIAKPNVRIPEQYVKDYRESTERTIAEYERENDYLDAQLQEGTYGEGKRLSLVPPPPISRVVKEKQREEAAKNLRGGNRPESPPPRPLITPGPSGSTSLYPYPTFTPTPPPLKKKAIIKKKKR